MTPLALAAVLVLGGAAPAADVPVTGSWTQLRATTPFGTSPDLQAQDGPALPVENGPLGVIAFSAVRWTHPGDLTLARVDATGPASMPEVWACAATAWPTGDRQPWSERPAVDCTRHVVGTASGDRVTWRTSTFGGPVDVLLVPAPGATDPFAVSFGAPTVDAFTTAPAPTPSPLAEPPPVPEPVLDPPVSVLPPVAPAAAVPVVSPPAALEPVVPVASPAPPAPATLAAGAREHAAWPGQLLLAFLALLLVVRAAFPSRPLAAPTSLLPTRAST